MSSTVNVTINNDGSILCTANNDLGEDILKENIVIKRMFSCIFFKKDKILLNTILFLFQSLLLALWTLISMRPLEKIHDSRK